MNAFECYVSRRRDGKDRGAAISTRVRVRCAILTQESSVGRGAVGIVLVACHAYLIDIYIPTRIARSAANLRQHLGLRRNTRGVHNSELA